MFNTIATTHFLTCGAADGATRKNAYDAALLQTTIGNTNLIKISSIIPPGCRLVEARELPPGALVPAAFTSITSDVPGEVISAGVAAAYPTDVKAPGLIMEYAASGHKEDIEAIVRRMVEEGMGLRGLSLKELHSVAVQHRVEQIGSAVAAVVLWND